MQRDPISFLGSLWMADELDTVLIYKFSEARFILYFSCFVSIIYINH